MFFCFYFINLLQIAYISRKKGFRQLKHNFRVPAQTLISPFHVFIESERISRGQDRESHSALYTAYSSSCSAHCTYNTAHSNLHTALYAEHIEHYTADWRLHITHCIFHTAHFTLHTSHIIISLQHTHCTILKCTLTSHHNLHPELGTQQIANSNNITKNKCFTQNLILYQTRCSKGCSTHSCDTY